MFRGYRKHAGGLIGRAPRGAVDSWREPTSSHAKGRGPLQNPVTTTSFLQLPADSLLGTLSPSYGVACLERCCWPWGRVGFSLHARCTREGNQTRRPLLTHIAALPWRDNSWSPWLQNDDGSPSAKQPPPSLFLFRLLRSKCRYFAMHSMIETQCRGEAGHVQLHD